MQRDDLIDHLNEFLEIQDVADYGPNGLQVEGAADVERVVTGVTASQALIDEAIRREAQMIVVHHGIFWDGQPVILKGHRKRRIQALLDADLTLLGYHLPLDRHPEVGNNAPALRDLGLQDLAPFARRKGISVGWKGRFPAPLPAAELLQKVKAYYGCEPLAFLEGPERIGTVGLVSGAAQSDIGAAVDEGLDMFITGEVSEYNPHLAREEGIHHISVGHHASERVGPHKLAEHLAATFADLQVAFVDIPNPV